VIELDKFRSAKLPKNSFLFSRGSFFIEAEVHGSVLSRHWMCENSDILSEHMECVTSSEWWKLLDGKLTCLEVYVSATRAPSSFPYCVARHFPAIARRCNFRSSQLTPYYRTRCVGIANIARQYRGSINLTSINPGFAASYGDVIVSKRESWKQIDITDVNNGMGLILISISLHRNINPCPYP